MGKSVCINSVLISLLYKASPEDVRMILIDPKKVEFNVYSKIPHLLVPVVTDPTKAAGALNWAVNEMEKRYDMIEEAGVRDIKSYNAYCKEEGLPTLPKIVIVIDELNDLMMSARKMVEASICRIAQKARAAGIHLLIGTQRPSVNVITGDIKVNIPARIAFRVNQLVDSRTILDMTGAEKLLPQGDMLFSPAGTPQRVQGAFVDDDEVKAVVSFLAKNVGEAIFDDRILADIEKEAAKCAQKNDGDDDDDEGGGNLDGVMDDPKFEAALDIAFSTGSISTSLLQRKISVGFGRASRFIDAMCEMGVVGESKGGAKPRELLMSRAEYEERRHRLFDE
jgi:S-DNA-T family DNA segregation ATPase FtsK/SpoIIIE